MPAPAPEAQQRAQPQHRRVTIAFYRNGVFTVDDGEWAAQRHACLLPLSACPESAALARS